MTGIAAALVGAVAAIDGATPPAAAATAAALMGAMAADDGMTAPAAPAIAAATTQARARALVLFVTPALHECSNAHSDSPRGPAAVRETAAAPPGSLGVA